MKYSYIISLLPFSLSVFSSPLPQTTDATSNSIATAQAGQASNGVFGRQGLSSGNLLNTLLAEIGNLPGIGGAITALSAVLTTFEQDIATLLGVQTTQNDGTGCKAMSVIFARGTTEPGNVGLVTGPPFFDALMAIVGANNMEVEGVDYSASVEGFLEGGDPTGSQTM